MVRTASTMRMALGTKAPDFALPDPSGKKVSLKDFAGGRALLVAFICNHCPYVKHIRKGFSDFAREFQAKGLSIAAINANDAEAYPDDSPAKMVEEVKAAGYGFPYLVDASQSAAKAYGAACTPDFFLFDKDLRLAYRGQFDDSRPDNGAPVTGKDLRAAAEAVLAGRPAPQPQKPSLGCNIKWKKGNEPDYFHP